MVVLGSCYGSRCHLVSRWWCLCMLVDDFWMSCCVWHISARVWLQYIDNFSLVSRFFCDYSGWSRILLRGFVFSQKIWWPFFIHPLLHQPHDATLSSSTKSDDFFSYHSLPGVRFLPQSPKTLQIQAPSYNNYFKKFFVSEGGFVRTQRTPLDPPLIFFHCISAARDEVGLHRSPAAVPNLAPKMSY